MDKIFHKSSLAGKNERPLSEEFHEEISILHSELERTYGRILRDKPGDQFLMNKDDLEKILKLMDSLEFYLYYGDIRGQGAYA